MKIQTKFVVFIKFLIILLKKRYDVNLVVRIYYSFMLKF